MTARFQALFGDSEMSLRRRRHVHYIRPRLLKHRSQVTKVPSHRKSLVELFRHQLFPIASGNNIAPADADYLRRMRVRDLPAANNGDFKHTFASPDSTRSKFSILPRTTPAAT